MRPIKFRIWDKEEQRLSKPFHFWQDSIEWENDVPMPMIFARATYERFEWLQYTGLKDVNGKEIYDGDIIAIADEVQAAITYRKDTASFICVSVKNWVNGNKEIGSDHLFGINSSEVIGSIYETPELLEQEVV